MTEDVLKGLGFSKADAARTVQIFKAQDEKRLIEGYENFSDDQKMVELAKAYAEELEAQFAADEAERAIAEGAASPAPKAAAS